MVRAFKTLTVTLAVLMLLPGCQALTGQTVGESIDDSVLTTSVKTKLAGDKAANLTRVSVDTTNGVVQLSGVVESAEQKARVGSLAAEVKGVKRVINNLQVQKQ